MKAIRRYLSLALISGMVFWIPDIIVHAISGYKFSAREVIVITILIPVVSLMFFEVMWRKWRKDESPVLMVISALLGIWVSGPVCMGISASFSGGGFSNPDTWDFLLQGTALFPLVTFEFSTYDGTLGALILTTILFPLIYSFRCRVVK